MFQLTSNKRKVTNMFLIIFVLHLFLLIITPTSTAAISCTNSSSTFIDSTGNDCYVYDSTIDNSTITDTTIADSNITNSTITFSEIRNSHIENLTITSATINNNILSSGKVEYNNFIYFPTFNILDVYTFLPYSLNLFSTSKPYVSNNNAFNVSFVAPDIGFSVVLNISTIDSTQNTLLMYDDGTYPDSQAFDTIFNREISISPSNAMSDGLKTINVIVNDQLGNTLYTSFDMILDNILPQGKISIKPVGQPGFETLNPEYSSIRFVALDLNFSDNYEIDKCRYRNNDSVFVEWEPCTNAKSWYLTGNEGNVSVIYQIRDIAGNIINLTDSIIYNSSGIGLDTTPPTRPTVLDEGDWTSSDNNLSFAWYNSTDVESTLLGVPIYYEYKLNDSTGLTLIDWNSTIETSRSIQITGLNLIDSRTYYLNVRAMNYNGNKSDISSSNGIGVDTQIPDAPSIVTDAPSNWTNTNSLTFNWTASDNGPSGIAGYSFILSRQTNITLGKVLIPLNNKTYSNLADGEYIFQIRAADTAGNWGPKSTSSIKTDRIKPTTPQMLNQSILSNNSNIRFNWTKSVDFTSGIDYYQFAAIHNDGTVIFNSTIGNQTYYVVNVPEDAMYNGKVRAFDLAGNPSYWSDEITKTIDTTSPTITLKKPLGRILTHNPFFAIITSEFSECSYTENTGNEIAPFDGTPRTTSFSFTNSTYHEDLIRLNPNMTTFQFSIYCTDRIGNWNSTTISFTRVSDAPINLAMVHEGTYYAGVLTSILLRATDNSNNGIGDLDKNQLSFSIANSKIEDFSLLDKGDGNFSIAFKMPEISGSQNISLKWYNSANITTNINIEPLNFKIEYSDDSFSPLSSDLIQYGKTSNYNIGTAMSNVSSLGITNNTFFMSTATILDDSYIFMTPPIYNPEDRENLLKENTFKDKARPTFGEPLEDEINKINLRLDYYDYNISGFSKISPGFYQLEIKNHGKDNDEIQISINIRDSSSRDRKIVKWE